MVVVVVGGERDTDNKRYDVFMATVIARVLETIAQRFRLSVSVRIPANQTLLVMVRVETLGMWCLYEGLPFPKACVHKRFAGWVIVGRENCGCCHRACSTQPRVLSKKFLTR